MSLTTGTSLADVGVDAVALKPSEVDLRAATDLAVETVTIDYEGRQHFPETALLRELASSMTVRATVPVRADGFDPLGDASRLESLPKSVQSVLVAGHPAYLTDAERKRAVAPRLEAARQTAAQPWVGTEGIERLALAVGGTQFELLTGSTIREARALRAAGFEGELAVYAPTVLSKDADDILDAVGAYTARRKPVRSRLPEDAPTDSSISGEDRGFLLDACHDYALAGTPDAVDSRIDDLHQAGIDHVVSYPARGLDDHLS
jgi:hypothetical protein